MHGQCALVRYAALNIGEYLEKLNKFSRFRFGNNDVFRLGYSVNTELMHEGDTCVLDIADGLWGLKVCRGVTCNGERIWKD